MWDQVTIKDSAVGIASPSFHSHVEELGPAQAKEGTAPALYSSSFVAGVTPTPAIQRPWFDIIKGGGL